MHIFQIEVLKWLGFETRMRTTRTSTNWMTSCEINIIQITFTPCPSPNNLPKHLKKFLPRQLKKEEKRKLLIGFSLFFENTKSYYPYVFHFHRFFRTNFESSIVLNSKSMHSYLILSTYFVKYVSE